MKLLIPRDSFSSKLLFRTLVGCRRIRIDDAESGKNGFYFISRRFAARFLDEPVKRVSVSGKPRFAYSNIRPQKERDGRFDAKTDEDVFDEEEPPVVERIDEYFEKMQLPDRRLTSDECSQLRRIVIESLEADDRANHLRSIDACILRTLRAREKFIWAFSYVEFLLANNLFNPGCVSIASLIIRNRFLESYSRDDTSDKEDIELIDQLTRKIHDKIDDEFPTVIQKSLTGSCMVLLACSHRWREALSWFQSITRGKHWSLFLPLTIQAFTTNEVSMAADLLRKCLHEHGTIIDSDFYHFIIWKVASTFVERQNEKAALDIVNMVIQAMADANISGQCLPRDVVPDVEKLFSKMKNQSYVISQSNIRDDGQCTSCGEVLQQMSLSDKEFESLKHEFMERIVNGLHVFQWTTPEERVKFERLLVREGPYDVIVDGLNVLHINAPRFGAAGAFEKLAFVLERLKAKLGNSTKILVTIRPYVKFERHKAFHEKLFNMATFFTCRHESLDDSFILYAALLSGPECYFLTNDLLRGQNQLLTPKGSALFQTWRRLRQISIWNKKLTDYEIMWPSKYAVHLQGNVTGYHFPLENDVDEVGTKFNVRLHEKSTNWLCIRRLNDRK